MLPQAAKYIKKIKDKKLKFRFQKAIDEILADYMAGEVKSGDLSGVFGYDIYYNNTNYEIAYSVEYVDDKTIMINLNDIYVV